MPGTLQTLARPARLHRRFFTALAPVVGLAVVLLTPPSGPATARMSDESGRYDILCQREWAGSAPAVPAPFDRWLIVLCLPDGQHLAPEKGPEGVAWVDPASGRPLLISAAAPMEGLSATERRRLGPERLRFSAFEGIKTEGGRRALADRLFADTFPKLAGAPGYDAAYQLNAHTGHSGETYALFFYVDSGTPRHLIVCAYDCEVRLRARIAGL